MPSNQEKNNVYIQRVNTVIGYIRQNLNDDLSLNTLAKVANFSPFHFHRIFKAITDETVNDLVTRMRLERAANLLRTIPKLSITAAAFEVGFSSVSAFSRAFKKHFGISTRQWDKKSPLENSKNCQFRDEFPRYTIKELSNFGKIDHFKVQIRSLPQQHLAYIRVFDSYRSFERIKDTYYRLLEWYQARGGRLNSFSLYGMSQDNPDVTPLKLCRFDWCIKVPTDWQGEGEVNITDFPACRVAAIRCAGDLDHENKVIQYLFRYWLPRSRYQPANLPGIEIYRRQPDEMEWKKFDIDCAVPVIPL